MSKGKLLTTMTDVTASQERSNRHIVAISGGVASAWVANWVKNNIDGEIIYYFNDVKWEHPGLYRFLVEVQASFGIDIYFDSDGRSPEDVFYDKKMLGSNRTPICSRILKAERLQKFVKQGDTVYFGIDLGEMNRAARLTPIYERLGCKVEYPLIDNMIFRPDMFKNIESLGLGIPQMYKDGFTHNNCSGGCVRAGKKQWVSLFRAYPDVYEDRERIEIEFTVWNNDRRLKKDPDYTPRDYHFMKDMSLLELRKVLEEQPDIIIEDDDGWQGECMGICGSMY